MWGPVDHGAGVRGARGHSPARGLGQDRHLHAFHSSESEAIVVT